MSLCLQSIVDEILRIKQGKPIKRVGVHPLTSSYKVFTVWSNLCFLVFFDSAHHANWAKIKCSSAHLQMT